MHQKSLRFYLRAFWKTKH